MLTRDQFFRNATSLRHQPCKEDSKLSDRVDVLHFLNAVAHLHVAVLLCEDSRFDVRDNELEKRRILHFRLKVKEGFGSEEAQQSIHERSHKETDSDDEDGNPTEDSSQNLSDIFPFDGHFCFCF